MTRSIMIVGVGGQGTLLASKILGKALLAQGYDVKLSEVHGMSQRGGSVVTYVKYGDCIHSPIVDRGEADFILSFEALEAARWLPYLKKDGLLITSCGQIPPMPVITGAAAYPQEIPERLRPRANVLALDALELARQAGSPKAVNLVLLGVLSQSTHLPEDAWQNAIADTVPAKYLEMNRKAFALGRTAGKAAK